MSMMPNPAYPNGHRAGLVCADKSRTLQSGKADADINQIVSRFLRTGILPAAANRPPIYGDLTVQPNLAQALQLDLAGRDAFAALPKAVREAVGSLDRFESWLKNPDNIPMAVRYGLVRLKEPSAPSAAPPAAPPTAVSPPVPPAPPAAK